MSSNEQNELGELMTTLDASIVERSFANAKTARARDRLGNATLLLLACAVATRSPMVQTGLPGGLARTRCMYCDAGPGPHAPKCLYRYALAVVRGIGCDVQTFQNSARLTVPRT